MNETTRKAITEYYKQRRCFICEQFGHCEHREIRVTMAELEWLDAHRPDRKPVASETVQFSYLHRTASR